MALESNSSGWLQSPTLPTTDISFALWAFWKSTPGGFASLLDVDNGTTFFDLESVGASTSVEMDPPGSPGAVTVVTTPGTGVWMYFSGVIASANGGASNTWARLTGRLPAKTSINNTAARAGTMGVAAEVAGGGSQLGPAVIGNLIVYDHRLSDYQLKGQAAQLAPMYQGCWAWLDFVKLLRVGKDRSGLGNNFTVTGTWVQSSAIPPVPESAGRTSEIWLANVAVAIDDPPQPTTRRTPPAIVVPEVFPGSAAAASLVSYAPDIALPVRAPAARPQRGDEPQPPLVLPVRWFSDASPAPASSRPRVQPTPAVDLPRLLPGGWVPDAIPMPTAAKVRPPQAPSVELPPIVKPWVPDASPPAPPAKPARAVPILELPPLVLPVRWFADAVPTIAPVRPRTWRPSEELPAIVRPWVDDLPPLPTRTARARATRPADELPPIATTLVSWAPDDAPRARQSARAPLVLVDPIPSLVLAVKTGWAEPTTTPYRTTRRPPEQALALPALATVTLTAWSEAPAPARSTRVSRPIDPGIVLPAIPTAALVAWGYEAPPAIPRRAARAQLLDPGMPPFAPASVWWGDDARPPAIARAVRPAARAVDVGPPIIVPYVPDQLVTVPRRALRVGRLFADDGSIYTFIAPIIFAPGFVNVGDRALWNVNVADLPVFVMSGADAVSGRVRVSDAPLFECVVSDAPVWRLNTGDR